MTGTSPPLPALSVRQPWAWLIVHGFKDFENRRWGSRYPARAQIRDHAPFDVLIHASAGMTEADYDEARQVLRHINHLRFQDGLADIVLPPRAALQRGGIVGRCRVVGWSESPANSPWAFTSGLILDQAEPLPFTPCKGALGFFTPRYA